VTVTVRVADRVTVALTEDRVRGPAGGRSAAAIMMCGNAHDKVQFESES
jgi:hypothetical protein